MSPTETSHPESGDLPARPFWSQFTSTVLSSLLLLAVFALFGFVLFYDAPFTTAEKSTIVLSYGAILVAPPLSVLVGRMVRPLDSTPMPSDRPFWSYFTSAVLSTVLAMAAFSLIGFVLLFDSGFTATERMAIVAPFLVGIAAALETVVAVRSFTKLDPSPA